MKNYNSLRFTLVAVIAAIILAGCGQTANNKLYIRNQDSVSLDQHAQNVLNEEEQNIFEVPYKLTPELKKLAWSLKDSRLGPMNQARKIAVHLLQDDSNGLGIKYARHQNFSAQDVYKYREANCISYTNLFIGIAREIGLQANYIEVTEVDTFSKVGGTVVYNSHICAAVYEGPNPYIVDFALRRYPQYHSWRAISDLEAAASLYNNIGSYHYLNGSGEGARKTAMKYFDMSRKLYPDYAQVYNNMGVVALREGEVENAEALFRKSLELRPGYFAAYQNLASIYLEQGNLETATAIMKQAVESEPRNQYAYMNLAKLQMKLERYPAAEENLRKALSIEETLAEARHDLSKLLIITGRPDEARQQLALALKHNADDKVAKNKMALIEELALVKAKIK